MSDATTPADPTDQIATVTATPVVAPDAQQYDWRSVVDAARNLILGNLADDLAAYIERLEAERDALHDALRWCSGSADFAPGGQAREGWQRQVAPLLDNAERVIRGE